MEKLIVIFFLVIITLDLLRPRYLWQWASRVIVQSLRPHFLVLSVVIAISSSNPLLWVFPVFLLILFVHRLRELKEHSPHVLRSFLFSPFTKKNFTKLTYPNRSGVKKRALFLQGPSKDSPAVIFVHGGGYRYGNETQQTDFLNQLCGVGYHVFSISYELLPTALWPKPVDDIEDFFNQFEDLCDSLQIKPRFLVIGGRSAGAHLSCHYLRYRSKIYFSGFIGLYGIYNFESLIKTLPHSDYLDLEGKLKSLLTEKVYKSPHELQNVGCENPAKTPHPPSLLIHGLSDSLIPAEQSQMFSQLLKSEGVSVKLLEVRGAEHSFEFNCHSLEGQLATNATQEFLRTLRELPTDSRSTTSLST